MKRMLICGMAISGLFSFLSSSYAQEGKAQERTLVLREAKQDGKTTVAIDAYLTGDILEVKVTAKMYATKPRISNIILVGPGIGRLSPLTKKTVASSTQEEEPYPTSKRGAFISFGTRTKTEKATGTVTKEMVEFKITADKIMPAKLYQIWVRVESSQSGGQPQGFKFDLKDFARLISK